MTKVRIEASDQDWTIVSGAATAAPFVSTARRFNGGFNTGGTRATGDEFSWSRYFPKSGTYRAKWITTNASNQAIMGVWIDVNTNLIFDSIDLYTAGSTNNVEYFSTIEVARGQHDIHFEVEGKNGSSSDENFIIQLLEFELIDEHPVLGEGPKNPRNGMVLLGYDEIQTAGDILNVTIPTKKFLLMRTMQIATGGAIQPEVTFNGDTGTNYASRGSQNGAADSTSTSQAKYFLYTSSADVYFFTDTSIVNILDQEKLMISEIHEVDTAGAGASSNRHENVGKWDDLTQQINQITVTNAGAGSFDVGSFIEVWGMD